jgi:hypothetical protein
MKKLILLLLLVPVIAWSQGQPKASNKGTKSPGVPASAPSNRSLTPGTLVWSQLPDCASGVIWSSQLDNVQAYDLRAADDFLFTTAPGEITAVKWWIGWFNGTYAAPSSFNIYIYDNASCLPGTLIATYNIPYANANEDGSCNTGGFDSREYWATLSPSFVPVANQHYWISFQPVLPIFPQTGMIATPSVTLCSGAQQFLAPWGAVNPAVDFSFELYASNQEVPVSNWALLAGGVLIAAAIFFRYRRMA